MKKHLPLTCCLLFLGGVASFRLVGYSIQMHSVGYTLATIVLTATLLMSALHVFSRLLRGDDS